MGLGEFPLSELVCLGDERRSEMETGRWKDDTAAELQKKKIGAIHITRNEVMAHHETEKRREQRLRERE